MLRKILDTFTNTRRPSYGAAAVDTDKLRNALLAINRDSAPFVIRDGGKDEVTLVAEWKIVDARWYEVFASAGLKDVFKILLQVRPELREVRALDTRYTISWRAGLPTLNLSVSGSRGQQWAYSAGTSYVFTENPERGQVYKYRFKTGEIRQPIQDAVVASGWTYKGVLSKRALKKQASGK